MSSPLATIKRIILWDFERATWPYDLLVALIVATVLLTPSSFFGDRDRPMNHTNRPELKAAAGTPHNSAQAKDQPGLASNAAPQSGGSGTEIEIPVDKLIVFLQTQGRADELQSNLQSALSLYLRDELNRAGTLDRYEVRLNPGGDPVSYRVWFR